MLATKRPKIRLYDFKERFVALLLCGEKTHTIRAERRYPAKPGDTLHLYSGLRTPKAKLLMRVTCVRVESIVILGGRVPRVNIDDHLLDTDEEEQLARRDGFSGFQEMVKFWTEPTNRLPFKGHIIHWRRG